MSPLSTRDYEREFLSQPIVVDTYPESAARNIHLNGLIKVTFNQRMLSSSITDTTFLVVKQDSYTPVAGTISYTSGTRTATFTPTEYLDADSTYIAIVVGNADEHARTVVGVKNFHSEPMVGNYSWQFYTGFSVSSDPVYAALASGVTGYEEPIQPDPSGFDKDGYLAVSWTSPDNYDTNVPVSGTVVEIMLNDSLEMEELSGLGQMVVGEDYIDTYSDYLNYYIDVENVASIGDSLVSTLDWDYDITYDTFRNLITLTGTSTTPSVNGYYNTNGVWTELGTLYGLLEENNEYTVTVKAGLSGLETNDLPEDYVFMFTTQFDPLFSSVSRIRLNIGPMIRNIPDDTINRFIHENSILAQRLYPTWAGIIPANNIPFYVAEYVTCKTKLDVLHAAMLGYAGSGGKKALADLSIEKDSPGTDIVRLAQGKIDQLLECIYEMENLVEQAGERAAPTYAVIGEHNNRRPITDYSWRRLPGVTRSPMSKQRRAPGGRSVIFNHGQNLGRNGRF